jgi:DNA-binding transcriptional LysR family regulator
MNGRKFRAGGGVNLENVNLRQIEAFLAVAEEMHFGRAAQRLFVSAPWLSHTVKDLERSLNVELLIRTTRSVELTPAGTVFAALASQVLTDLAMAIRTTHRNLSGRMRHAVEFSC